VTAKAAPAMRTRTRRSTGADRNARWWGPVAFASVRPR
jgi:hypothetical protein